MARKTQRKMRKTQHKIIRKWLVRSMMIGLLAWIVGVGILVVRIHQTGEIDDAQPADAIVVLGAGIRRNGQADYALTRRSLHAAQLWQRGYADTIICTGGQAPRTPRSEAEACADVLIERGGVDPAAILLEMHSRSTEENALFTRPLLVENGFEDVLLVSDSFHILRARYIFGQQGIDVYASPVPRELIRGRGDVYGRAVQREIIAFHWQIFKDALNLPYTHFPFG